MCVEKMSNNITNLLQLTSFNLLIKYSNLIKFKLHFLFFSYHFLQVQTIFFFFGIYFCNLSSVSALQVYQGSNFRQNMEFGMHKKLFCFQLLLRDNCNQILFVPPIKKLIVKKFLVCLVIILFIKSNN